MASWSQKKLLLTIGGVAVVVCGAAVGGVYYAQGCIDEIMTQVAAKADQVVAADQKIAKIPAIEKEVIILRENLDEYVKILPDQKELNDFLRMLNDFERLSGIRGTGLKQGRNSGKGGGRFTPIEYTYEMKATLWQGLKFMNLIENFERFVSIIDFSITPGKDGEKVDGELVHQIKLTMRTYRYNAGTKCEDVAIPSYEDRKEELREEIWKRMQEIRLDHYEHPGMQGRRDIFVDPRESGVDGVETGISNEKQREVMEKYIGLVQELQRIVDTIGDQGTTLFQQYSLKKRLRKQLGEVLAGVDKDASMITFRPYRLRWAQEIVQPLERLQQWTPEPGPTPTADPYLPKAELERLITQMAEDCANGQLEQARERYEAVQDRLGVPVDDARHELAVEAKRWHIKATTALDFKSLDLDVKGVVVNGEGRSGVLLNGEVFEEGDYVSDELLVKQVEEEQVWFVFRGLTLVRTM